MYHVTKESSKLWDGRMPPWCKHYQVTATEIRICYCRGPIREVVSGSWAAQELMSTSSPLSPTLSTVRGKSLFRFIGDWLAPPPPPFRAMRIMFVMKNKRERSHRAKTIERKVSYIRISLHGWKKKRRGELICLCMVYAREKVVTPGHENPPEPGIQMKRKCVGAVNPWKDESCLHRPHINPTAF